MRAKRYRQWLRRNYLRNKAKRELINKAPVHPYLFDKILLYANDKLIGEVASINIENKEN